VSLQRLPSRVRLTLGFAGVMIVLFGGLALLLHTLVENSLDQAINRSLQTHADDLASLVAGKREFPRLPESDGTFAQIIDPRSGAVLVSTPDHAAPLLSGADLRSASTRATIRDDTSQARLLAEPVNSRPKMVLVVGSSLQQRNGAMTTLSELLFAGGPLLLLLTCAAGYVLAARALAPVERMSAQAARIYGASGGERLPVSEANDELHRLGETLNEMLDRVEETLARERSFVAEVGHELRTPLSVLKLELELALGPDVSKHQLQARVRSVAEEVDRLIRIAQDLLVIARAEQGRLPLQRHDLDVAPVLAAVASRFEPAAREMGRTVLSECTGELRVVADRAWLEQALTNLVSNALRYGGGPVLLRAVRSETSVELHVVDDGAGFEPDFLRRAFERFSRADPARWGVGAGLGLSIVRVIAEAHGGSACASNREHGGADVWVSLPRTAPA
jgi:two-component system OmpR family sensor kinase